jgi:uncharacterized membrane protein YvlD (DUF360 family)
MNKLLLYFLFFIGLIISSLFYTFSSYYFRLGEQLNVKFQYIYIISIIFGLISFLIKIPIYYYFGKNFNILTIHVYFLVITFSLLYFYSYYILSEKIPLHTIIILFTIIMLLVINDLIDIFNKKNK